LLKNPLKRQLKNLQRREQKQLKMLRNQKVSLKSLKKGRKQELLIQLLMMDSLVDVYLHVYHRVQDKVVELMDISLKERNLNSTPRL
jgi:hypothetical protein